MLVVLTDRARPPGGDGPAAVRRRDRRARRRRRWPASPCATPRACRPSGSSPRVDLPRRHALLLVQQAHPRVPQGARLRADQAADYKSFFFFVSACARLVFGWLADRFDKRNLLAHPGRCSSPSASRCCFLVPAHRELLLPALFLIGVGYGGLLPSIPILAVHYFGRAPPRHDPRRLQDRLRPRRRRRAAVHRRALRPLRQLHRAAGVADRLRLGWRCCWSCFGLPHQLTARRGAGWSTGASIQRRARSSYRTRLTGAGYAGAARAARTHGAVERLVLEPAAALAVLQHRRAQMAELRGAALRSPGRRAPRRAARRSPWPPPPPRAWRARTSARPSRSRQQLADRPPRHRRAGVEGGVPGQLVPQHDGDVSRRGDGRCRRADEERRQTLRRARCAAPSSSPKMMRPPESCRTTPGADQLGADVREAAAAAAAGPARRPGAPRSRCRSAATGRSCRVRRPGAALRRPRRCRTTSRRRGTSSTGPASAAGCDDAQTARRSSTAGGGGSMRTPTAAVRRDWRRAPRRRRRRRRAPVCRRSRRRPRRRP